MASVYDHAVVKRALSAKHTVLFFGMDGRQSGKADDLQRVAASVKGVDEGSARVSVETAALSMSIDPDRTSVATAQYSLQSKLVLKGVTLQLLRVMDKPAEFVTP